MAYGDKVRARKVAGNTERKKEEETDWERQRRVARSLPPSRNSLFPVYIVSNLCRGKWNVSNATPWPSGGTGKYRRTGHFPESSRSFFFPSFRFVYFRPRAAILRNIPATFIVIAPATGRAPFPAPGNQRLELTSTLLRPAPPLSRLRARNSHGSPSAFSPCREPAPVKSDSRHRYPRGSMPPR